MQCCKLELVVSIHGLVGEKQKFLSNHVVIINFKINFITSTYRFIQCRTVFMSLLIYT